jgi:hypothetical protein
LRSSIEPLLAGKAGVEVWLFGSLARGDWDARSDVDLLAVAPDQGRWLERQRGDDPWWRASAAMRSVCSPPRSHAQAWYHSSQAAEKALKSVLLDLELLGIDTKGATEFIATNLPVLIDKLTPMARWSPTPPPCLPPPEARIPGRIGWILPGIFYGQTDSMNCLSSGLPASCP